MGAKERYNESLKKSGRKERPIKISIYKETSPIKRNNFFAMYCKIPEMDTYDDELRVQHAMAIAYDKGFKDGSQSIVKLPKEKKDGNQ